MITRGLLDSDLAELYGVQTKVLVQAVKRNITRFPYDFMFQLTADEFAALRSQTVTTNPGRGGRRTAPYAFTEQGVAMLSSVLSSPRAIGVNVEIMRTFVRVRELSATHSELANRLSELEERTEAISMQHDTFSRNTRNQLKQVFDALRELMTPTEALKRRASLFNTRCLLEDVRKITRGLANIAQGLESCLYMGNIDSLRDWGHAKDYVRMQWMMLQQEQPEDFVIATGVQYSVRQFISWSAEHLGIKLRFEGQGVDEVGIVEAIEGDKAPALKVGDTIVKIDPRYFRPAEVETLLGDPSKAKAKLGWTPEITVQEMCEEMVAADLESAKRHALLKKHGFDVAVSAER